MTTIRVEYAQTISTPGSYSSTRIGGTVETELAGKDPDYQREWGVVYAGLKAQVDAAVVLARASDEPSTAETPAPASTPEPPPATAEVSQASVTVPPDPVAGTQVDFKNCRVMFPVEHKPKTAQRRETVRMRIGDGNGEQIPGQYVYVKSFDPEVMSTMRTLRKGDMVDVQGEWDSPWVKGSGDNAETVYDVILKAGASSVTRCQD